MRGKGFTLVELLVTISIMAILMTVALVAFDSVRKGSRDTKRKSDISSIQAGLEQFRADQGYYPLLGTATCANGSFFGDCPLKNPTGTKTYMSKIPAGSPAYSYTAKPSCNNTTIYCTNYCLYATVESSSNTAPASPNCAAALLQYQTQAP